MKNDSIAVLVATLAMTTTAMSACKSPVIAPPTTQVQAQALTMSAPVAGLVVAAIPLSPADEVIRGRLVSLGYAVQLINDDASVSSDATGKALLVVSESSASAKILDKYRAAAVPVVSLEVAIWDDLGMTGAGWQTDIGDAVGVASIAVVNASHPLAGQLSVGTTLVASATSKIVWGKPMTTASVAAALVGDASKATLFGYEAGAAMVNGFIAPARRVGVFAGDPTAASFTQAGARLFDGAIIWATRTREMLFVVGQTVLTPADRELYQRATKLGFGVHLSDGPNAQVVDTVNKALVLISESTVSATVDTRLRNIAVPVLCLEPALFDEFGMTGEAWLTNYGDVSGQASLDILTSPHPLAAGLSGRVQVSLSPTKFVWGTPTAAAVKIATVIQQNPASSTPVAQAFGIFGYPAGASMFNLAAPARRVGWFAGDGAASSFTEMAWRLFDAAVLWSTDAKGPCEGRSDGFACSDGNGCTLADTCLSGTCTPGGAKVCSDQNPCTTDTCNVVTGCQYTPDVDAGVCDSGTPMCAPKGLEPPTSAAVVLREGFEDCKDAWVDGSGKEKPASQYVVDPAWGVCTGSTGRVLKVDDATLGGRYQSSWFKLVPIAPAKTYCLSVWINWKAGGMPFVALQSYDEQSAPQGPLQRVLGTGAVLINPTPGYHRYHETFTTSVTTHFVHIEQGVDLTATPKPGTAETLFDDLLIAEGQCPAPG